jgi:hypothetical protein
LNNEEFSYRFLSAVVGYAGVVGEGVFGREMAQLFSVG